MITPSNLANLDKRKKVNFMISVKVLEMMQKHVPAGERSDFANKALNDALLYAGRRKAAEQMDEMRKNLKLKITDAEIRKLRAYGRA